LTLSVSRYVVAFEFVSVALIGWNLRQFYHKSTAMFQEIIGIFQKILHIGGIFKISVKFILILNYIEYIAYFLIIYRICIV